VGPTVDPSTQNARAVASTCVTSLEFRKLQHRAQIKQEVQHLLGWADRVLVVTDLEGHPRSMFFNVICKGVSLRHFLSVINSRLTLAYVAPFPRSIILVVDRQSCC